MKMFPYEDKYYSDVMQCLSRNFKSMNGLSEDRVNEIVGTIFDYPWIDKDVLYSRGAVLLDDNSVVGYLGAVYSKQMIGGRLLTVCNFSTWAIDSKYRISLFSCMKEFHKTADVFLDYSPNSASVEIEKRLFKYEEVENEIYVFKPSLNKRRGELRFRKIHKAEQISDEGTKKKFEDHKSLVVKCWQISAPDGSPYYLFYDIIIEKIHGIPTRWVKVLDVSDCVFFGNNADEIITELQRKELAFLETDARFFNGSAICSEKNYYRRNTTRLAFSSDLSSADLRNLGLLYSEIVLIRRNR